MHNEEITIQLYGPAEAHALVIAIAKRIDALQESVDRRDTVEFFALWQIAARIQPHIDALAEQEQQA